MPSKNPVKKSANAKARKADSVPESIQPYLPGMSRRGRPRSPNPLAASERASLSRERRLAAGAKRIELLLEPTTAAELDALAEYYRVTRTEIISRLIGKAAKRISPK